MILEHTMQGYWNSQPRAELVIAATPMNMTPAPSCDESILSDFNCYYLSLVAKDVKEGSPAELCCYLKEMPADVTRDTDIVKWWKDNCQLYPTLSWIALNALPCQVSSVPCEQNVSDLAAWNSGMIEEADLEVYEDMLTVD